MSGKRVVMAKRKQEIKVVLHTPSKLDVERQRQTEEFWIEKMVAFIEKFNPNELERKYLTEQLKKETIDNPLSGLYT